MVHRMDDDVAVCSREVIADEEVGSIELQRAVIAGVEKGGGGIGVLVYGGIGAQQGEKGIPIEQIGGSLNSIKAVGGGELQGHLAVGQPLRKAELRGTLGGQPPGARQAKKEEEALSH